MSDSPLRDPRILSVMSALATEASVEWVPPELVRRGWVQAGRITPRGRDAFEAYVRSIAETIGTTIPLPSDAPKIYDDATFPFLFTGTFEEVLCVSASVPPDWLRARVPEPLSLDRHKDEVFVSLLVLRLADCRPSWAPKFVAHDCTVAAYRAHVRGPRGRGCSFVRTDTNSLLMATFGNRLNEFKGHRFETVPISMMRRAGDLLVSVDTGQRGGDVVAVADVSRAAADPPAGSRFDSRAAVQEFIVDVFHAFEVDPRDGAVRCTEINRGEWDPRFVPLSDSYFQFFPEGTRIDHAFVISGVRYTWLPLRKERVK